MADNKIEAINRRMEKLKGSTLAYNIDKASLKYGIDSTVLWQILYDESSLGTRTGVQRKGNEARGLFQILPSTGWTFVKEVLETEQPGTVKKWAGKTKDNDFWDEVGRYLENEWINVEAAALFLKELEDKLSLNSYKENERDELQMAFHLGEPAYIEWKEQNKDKGFSKSTPSIGDNNPEQTKKRIASISSLSNHFSENSIYQGPDSFYNLPTPTPRGPTPQVASFGKLPTPTPQGQPFPRPDQTFPRPDQSLGDAVKKPPVPIPFGSLATALPLTKAQEAAHGSEYQRYQQGRIPGQDAIEQREESRFQASLRPKLPPTKRELEIGEKEWNRFNDFYSGKIDPSNSIDQIKQSIQGIIPEKFRRSAPPGEDSQLAEDMPLSHWGFGKKEGRPQEEIRRDSIEQREQSEFQKSLRPQLPPTKRELWDRKQKSFNWERDILLKEHPNFHRYPDKKKLEVLYGYEK